MGSMIHLTLGRITLDWGKNEGFTNHSALFRPGDLTQVPSYAELLANADILEEKGINQDPPDNRFYRELHIRAENINTQHEALNAS